MFKKKADAILDIGSEYMRLVVLNKSGKEAVISAYAKHMYSGFQDGEFLCPDEIYPAMKRLIESIYLRFKTRIKSLVVTIPGEFICTVDKNVEKDIDNFVKQKDINEIFAIGNTYHNHNNFEVLNIEGIYFKTNKNPKRLIDPIGEECDSIAAKVAYTLSERYFTDTIRQAANALKIKVKFVSAIVPQIKYISKKYMIDTFQDAIFIDLGYLNTTLAYFMGERLVDIKTFSIGGASAAADITLVKEIPYGHSYKLYKKLNLNIQPKEEDSYHIHSDKENFSYDISTINAIVEERIYNLGAHILDAINNMGVHVEKDTPVFLSGCSICLNRGVKEILEACIGNKIEIVSQELFDNDTTENLSIVSLINEY
ncbi:MAG: hypothetical protein QM214_05105 [Bacillota bacterium]|jgi:cell division ATPase FtsA|nr:hypothetical protein [Bacillota bacterium]HHU43170.1 hypothetical protein [Clostridiales bacterium]